MRLISRKLYGNGMPRSIRRSIGTPAIMLLFGAGLWGVIWYPMRLLEAQGLNGIWLSLILYVAALIASLPRTTRAFRELFEAGKRASLFALALAGGWTNTAFVLAILDGNVMRVLLLFYLCPVWTVVFGWFLLGERPSRLALGVLMLAMFGALMLLWDPEYGTPWPQTVSDWLALSAGFAFALSNVFVRKCQSASIEAKAVSVWIGVILICAILIFLFGMPAPQVSVRATLAAAALGVFGILVMTVLVQYGVTHMPVHRSAVILLFELVTGAISQQLLTDEIMTLVDWAGGVLIVAGAYVAAKIPHGRTRE